jgi:hypothetical protein
LTTSLAIERLGGVSDVRSCRRGEPRYFQR